MAGGMTPAFGRGLMRSDVILYEFRSWLGLYPGPDQTGIALRKTLVQATGSVFQHQIHLLAGYAGKPFHELVDRGTAFQIREERGNWNASSSENPSSADLLRVTFDSWTGSPIEHER